MFPEACSHIVFPWKYQAGRYPLQIRLLSIVRRSMPTSSVRTVLGSRPGGHVPSNNSWIVRVGSWGVGSGIGNKFYFILVNDTLRLEGGRKRWYLMGYGGQDAGGDGARDFQSCTDFVLLIWLIELKPRNGSARVVKSETRPEPDPRDGRPDPNWLDPNKTRVTRTAQTTQKSTMPTRIVVRYCIHDLLILGTIEEKYIEIGDCIKEMINI